MRRNKKKIFISVALFIIALFGFIILRITNPVEMTYFSKIRINALEKLFAMDFENVKLNYFHYTPAPDYDRYELKFKGVEDYKEFMEDNYSGKKNKKWSLEETEYEACYSCRVGGDVVFMIYFYKDGENYRAEVVS